MATDRDESQADRATAASDRDDAALDRDQSQADAEQRTADRDQTAVEREHAAEDREHAAEDRARAASDRDDAAFDRDRSQADAEQRTADRDQTAVERGHAAEDREQAAKDRDHGGTDRALAAEDRAHAASDREQARVDLKHAQLDGLTGALGRELGMVEIESEINRARRGGGRLVLAYVDVDGLKTINDRWGHAAGDALLRDVVGAMRTHLRSYDPIVRVGGDEFICVLTDADPEAAQRRFQEIGGTVERTQPGASISVGFAALHPEDTLAQLTQRGDTALYEAKQTKPPPT